MISKRIAGLCAALSLSLGLGACTDDYGYGGLSVGYGGGGYYGDPYYGGNGYGGYGYGYPANYGWYGNYYYPGAGIYVYDQYRRPFRWNGVQQRYWKGRQRYRGRDWNGQGSWNGFDRRTQPNGGWQGRADGNPQWQGNGNRQWRGGNGNSRWQGNRSGNGVTGQGQSVRPGGNRGDRAAGAAQGGSGQWSGRSWRGREPNEAGRTRTE